MLCAFSSKFRNNTRYVVSAFLGSAENPCKYTLFFSNAGSFFCGSEIKTFSTLFCFVHIPKTEKVRYNKSEK